MKTSKIKTLERPQDDITWEVMNDLAKRSQRGFTKYNTTLKDNNKDDYMNHLYEELLDAAQYIKKERSIIPEIQELIHNHSNDAELGALIRHTYGKK